ncbi:MULTISPECIES: DUF6234 family protein [unclassified Streptomyces]|uniref:DUF6234 family protein n=1 Tax=unclassified Streptomyces TaxID=2593676 RepID=UPI00093ADEFD|nr:DUF6234 family protein [Streptomyces sp. TSRI0107]OKJ88489.1 hypothetical protein AMK31_08390 [Streptomyces sp. TSRI0107]
MSADTERSGRGAATVLIVVELAVLAVIWLSWAATYWSWDPQSYGDRPGPYLRKAAFVPAAALVLAVVAALRRARTVAISQLVLAAAVCGLILGAKGAGERAYESSYRDACRAGVLCDAPRSP